jgi:hypothetical protein
MKPIVTKVLESGLVDKATAQLMELWGYLPEGSVDQVNEDRLKGATHDTLKTLANDLAVEVEKEHAIRETYLDLERIRWPVTIQGIYSPAIGQPNLVVGLVPAVMDRMGRYYFRIQDVNEKWFVPGHLIQRYATSKDDGTKTDFLSEKILHSQTLYIGEQGVCIQVSTDASA